MFIIDHQLNNIVLSLSYIHQGLIEIKICVLHVRLSVLIEIYFKKSIYAKYVSKWVRERVQKDCKKEITPKWNLE